MENPERMMMEPMRAGTITLGNANIELAKKSVETLTQYYKDILKSGIDYGTIPGTQKPSLWKPGAEILARSLGLAEDIQTVEKVEKFETTPPFFHYVAECRLYGRDGFLGNGFGSANSKESKFAFRWVREGEIPAGQEKESLPSRASKYGKSEFRIQRPDEEIFDQANNVLKRASKRAFVEAVLRVTGASRIFTQDLDEDDEKHATEASSREAVAVTVDEVAYKLSEYTEQISVTKVDTAAGEHSIRVLLQPKLMLNVDAFAGVQKKLSDWGAIWVNKEKGGPYFEIRVKE